MNKLSKDTKKSMMDRIVTSLILVLVCVPCLLFGNWFFIALVFVVAFFACHEFINAPKNKSYSLLLHTFLYVLTLSFIYWVFIKNNLSLNGWNMGNWGFNTSFSTLSVSVIGIAVGFLCLFSLTLNRSGFNISDATYLCTMSIFIGLAIQSFMFLRFHPSYAFARSTSFFDIENATLFIFVVIGTFLSDIGAYFCGVLFGRHKMNEKISPKKTWEGFVGGVMLSASLSFVFAFLLAKNNIPILPIFDIDHWYNILIVSIIMPFTANIGDFIFSSIKRNYNIKDFGTLLKGHGGILDRIDSLLVTSLVTSILIVFMEHGWDFLL